LLINPLPWHGGSSGSTWIQVCVLLISCSRIFRMFLACYLHIQFMYISTECHTVDNYHRCT
jgi:hypothetical protein